jgi:fluoroacetyl-CoA thioesterase
LKDIFKLGDKKTYTLEVEPTDTATFDSGQVHPVYATFALARDAEWACRLFVLEMKEDDEEGIGTFISVNHVSPALVGDIVRFETEVKSIIGNSIICSYKAYSISRLIAEGETGQKILKKTKFERIFEGLKE